MCKGRPTLVCRLEGHGYCLSSNIRHVVFGIRFKSSAVRLLRFYVRSIHYRFGIKASPACDCGAPYQTSRHIVEECPLRLLDGGFKKLVSCDDDALSWLNSLDIDI